MPSRLTLAAGVLGVASLAFVGVGGYAAFTSNVNLDTSATPGTFLLNASAGSTGEGCATGNTQTTCLPWDAGNYQNNKGTSVVNYNNSTIETLGANAKATWTIPNMAPGDTYYADYTLKDVGTLQGKVSTVTYTIPSSLTTTQLQLLSDMTVTVQELTGSTSSGNTWTNLPRVNGTNVNSSQVGAGNYPANGNYTFSTSVLNSAVPFLQPVGTSTDEQSAEFRVVYTLLDSAGNSVEHVTVTPSLSFIGTSLP